MKKSFLIFVNLLVCMLAWAEEPEAPTVKKITVEVEGVSFNMVEVKGGRFNMGGTAEQYNCEDDEYPIHVVSLGDFFIGETEVTQELWTAVMGDNPSGFNGEKNLPVERVMWIECQTFVEKLTSLTGIEFRLPTESEWEFAARGGIYTKYYQYSGSNDIDEVAWGSNKNETHPVGQLKPNELGIYDMSGNVFEWCQDYFGDYDMFPVEAPKGPETGETRIRRGGSWGGSPHGCRVSYRNYELENIRFNYIGLRLAATTIDELDTKVSNIKKDGKTKSGSAYNVAGQPTSEGYKGIVIEDGTKHIAK